MSVSPIPLARRFARRVLVRRYSRPTPRVLTPAQRACWDDFGFLVLPGHFGRADIDAVNGYVDRLWRESRQTRAAAVIDIFIGTERERRTRLCDAPPEARQQPYKLNDLYLESSLVRNLVLEERLARVVEELVGGMPLVCNTLNLEHGSQQRFHTDSLYMAPEHGSHLVASWIALEESSPAAGPLRYYPGSHKIPPYTFSSGRIGVVDDEMPRYYDYMARELAQRGLQPEAFLAKPGDAFIWHCQLYHGGAPILDPSLTRRSLVTHYWRARDLARLHGRVRPGRYYLKRPPQAVGGPVDDH